VFVAGRFGSCRPSGYRQRQSRPRLFTLRGNRSSRKVPTTWLDQWRQPTGSASARALSALRTVFGPQMQLTYRTYRYWWSQCEATTSFDQIFIPQLFKQGIQQEQFQATSATRRVSRNSERTKHQSQSITVAAEQGHTHAKCPRTASASLFITGLSMNRNTHQS